jgi:Bacterial extracellular solute-binding protein
MRSGLSHPGGREQHGDLRPHRGEGGPRPEAARAWLAFIGSPDALKIVERYGFKPHRGDAG